MPSINVIKSIEIDSSPEPIFKVLTDFKQWRIWSPWLITEPEASVHIASDARSYSWTGVRTGEGSMEIADEKTNTEVHYNLAFFKPWKSKATVKFELKEKGSKTLVSWSMNSSLPLLMFWMKKMMTAYIGMDYERGLWMLKDYIETGDVPSQLEFVGEETFDGTKYIGKTTQCRRDNIGEAMQKDFEIIGKFLQDNSEIQAKYGLSIYHEFDAVKNRVNYTCGFAVETPPSENTLPKGMTVGEIPSLTLFKTKHTGPYRHVGNAWSAMIAMQRAKSFKTSNQHHPFELYLNSPLTTPENELITEVCFPAK